MYKSSSTPTALISAPSPPSRRHPSPMRVAVVGLADVPIWIDLAHDGYPVASVARVKALVEEQTMIPAGIQRLVCGRGMWRGMRCCCHHDMYCGELTDSR